jgi:alkaline phosphatase D
MLRRSLVAGALGLWLPTAARAEPPLAADPFALGVASGRPTQSSIVLWTRLVADGDRSARLAAPITVGWSIAEDAAMQRVVARGEAIAEARWAHSVHVEAEGLKSGRPYWYRFTVRGKASPIGRTRTSPAADDRLARLRFAFAACQHYQQGYYSALHHMAQEDIDLVVFLGDYIYDVSTGLHLARGPDIGRSLTLDSYRDRYALYKADPNLQAVHAAFPWITTWDDHEVADDYADDMSPAEPDPRKFLMQRAAAYQAYWEHMPLPLSLRPQGPSMRLYERYRFGDLVEFHVLDDRQYRSHLACHAALPSSAIMHGCAERLDPRRTMLGAAQEAWLADGLARASTRWTVIAQETLMAQVDREPGKQAFWHDGWDGYAPARQRLLDAVAASPVRDTLVISGDVHSFWANDLKRDFDAAGSPTLAAEFVGGSVTTQGPPDARVQAEAAHLPYIHYAKSERNGYGLASIDAKAAYVAFRVVDTVKQAQSPISTLKSFIVEAGKPGIVVD